MVILKMTETQAGEYLLLIQSEATNYTILFTVSIRSKSSLLRGISGFPTQWPGSREFLSSSCTHDTQASPRMWQTWGGYSSSL